MGIFDRWKKKEEKPKTTECTDSRSGASIYDEAMELLSSSDYEINRKGRKMMCEYAWRGNCNDVRVYMWMATEFERQGGYSGAAEWYEKAMQAGVREAKDGYLRCNNPYHVNSYCSIDGSRGCGTPALRAAQITEEKQRTDYKAAIEKLERNITRKEALDCLNTISQIASAYGCVVPDAQVWMGNYYETVMEDLKTAASWFKKASDCGDGNGARCYADMLMSGRGVEQNSDEAIKYYILAAERGQKEAQFVMGQYYERQGKIGKAKNYYKKSAKSGFSAAIQRLNDLEQDRNEKEDNFRSVYQPAMVHKYAELIQQNYLDQDGLLEFYAAIYQPDDFCEKAYAYCNKQYGDKTTEKIAFEYCMTSFYGAICTTALWKGIDHAYEHSSVWDVLYQQINVEFTDSNAERLMGIKQGEEKAEKIFDIISEFIYLAQVPLQKTDLDKDTSLFIMQLAYKLGLLVAKKELRLPNKEFVREYLGKEKMEREDDFGEDEDLEDEDLEDEGQEFDSPHDFYKNFLTVVHHAANEIGYANRGVIFIPELISMGTETVLAFLKDQFFQNQFCSNPRQYYYVIMTLCLQSGIVFAEKWHKDFKGLKNGYVQKIIEEGPADEANRIMVKTLHIRGNEAQKKIYQSIFNQWLNAMEPYWILNDARDYIFNSMLAAYQLGISMILEKYGF